MPDGGTSGGIRRPDIDTADIIAMYEAGWSQAAIAQCYDSNRALVHARLVAAGVLPRERQAPRLP